jgi:hypothetical protein
MSLTCEDFENIIAKRWPHLHIPVFGINSNVVWLGYVLSRLDGQIYCTYLPHYETVPFDSVWCVEFLDNFEANYSDIIYKPRRRPRFAEYPNIGTYFKYHLVGVDGLYWTGYREIRIHDASLQVDGDNNVLDALENHMAEVNARRMATRAAIRLLPQPLHEEIAPHV